MHTFSKQVLTSLLILVAFLPSFAAAQGIESFYSYTIGSEATGFSSYHCEVDQFEIISSSAIIAGETDSFPFIFKELTNDVDIKARILANTASLTGLMIRSGTGVNRSFALVGLSGGKTITRYRSSSNASTTDGNLMNSASWIRIRREADLISSYYSNDGASWVLVESKTVNLGSQVSVGMVGVNGAATFANVSVIGTLEQIDIIDPIPVDPGPVEETVPNKPLGLVAFSTIPGRVELGWTDGSDNEAGFRIRRSTGSGDFAVIGTVGANVTNFADTTVEAGATYTYNLVSFNDAGTSIVSNSRQISIPGTSVGAVPNAPSGFVALFSNGKVSFSWNDNSDNETGFLVERSSATGVYQQIGTVASNVTTFSDSLIVAGSTYTYRVLAFNGSGNSPASNSQVIVVPENTDPGDPTVDPTEPSAEVFTVSDIGAEEAGSSANYDSEKDMFRISTAGGQIWGTKDDFNYVYREVSGDVEATVKISSIIVSDKSGQAGIMFRESEEEGSRHAFLTVSAFKGVALERRTQPDGGTTRSGKGNVSAPVWLRLIKEGNYLSAYYSVDGDNWSFLSEDIIDFPDAIFIGLAVAANGEDQTVEADFEEFKIVELNLQAATETFISADIGKVGVNGDALYDPVSDSFLIEASGGDIGYIRDAFHYVYREISGDFESIAKIESLVVEEDWGKTGLMIRESLLPDSPYYAIFMAHNVGIVHQHRATYGGHTVWSKIDNVNTPFWVKVSRSGTLYRDFYSLDGVNWTLMNETTLELSDPLYVGMALTSHKEGSLAYAEFSNVSVSN